MNVKVAERYVDLLTDIIDKKVRTFGRDVLFDKEYILNVMTQNLFDDSEDTITEKIYKETIKWFKERHILTTIGNTSNLKYQLHPDFKFKLSKVRKTVERQCYFIIGQLLTFSNKVYNDSESVYSEFMKSETMFQLLPTFKPQIVKDTVSSLIIHKHNEDYEGIYTYELLQTLLLTHSSFDIKIENDSINTVLKGVVLKDVVFNSDTVSLKFNNSSFELDSFDNIKDIKIPLPTDIYENIEESLKYLQQFGEKTDILNDFLSKFQIQKVMFFKNILDGD